MHTRRLAAFLLGIWMGGSLLVVWFQFYNLRFASSLLLTPSDSAVEITKRLPDLELRQMLHYFAAEQSRRYVYLWEEAEAVLALTLGACLFLGTQKRIFPLILCGMMLLVVIFQHTGVTPELAFRGRQADFPPGSNTTGILIRMYALEQVYAWIEGAKLLVGVILASYLFVFRAHRSRKQLHAIDNPDHSHVNG